MERFRFAVDLDGVVANYFASFYKARIKHRPDLRPPPSPRSYSFEEDPEYDLPTRESFLEFHNMLVDRGFLQTLSPVASAPETLRRLSEQEVSIHILTHRFHRHGANAQAVSDTVYWLDIHNIPYRALTVVEDKTAVLADLYIDDSPHNIEALEAAGRSVITFDTTYNQGVGKIRAKTWEDVEDIVLERQAEWMKANGN